METNHLRIYWTDLHQILGIGTYINIFIIRFEYIRDESWIYSMGQKNGLRAFGYNSAEGEPIWMKFRTLWSKNVGDCWQILGAIRAVATVWQRAEIMFLSDK